MTRPTRANSGLRQVDAKTSYLPRKLTSSALIRSMINAPVMSTPPTITASATPTLTFVGLEFGQPNWPNSQLFRVSGAPLFNNSGDNRTYPRDTAHLDGTTGIWSGSYRIEFDCDDSQFEFKTKMQANSYFRIWVNEQPHASTMQPLNNISGQASDAWVKVTFPTHAYRRIMIELEGSNPTPFNGLRRTVTGGFFPPMIRSPRFMWLGDSYGFGLGATYRSSAFPIQLGRLLGWADVWNFTSVSSTGILKAASSTIGNYRSRLATDVIPYAPDVLVIAGSINDEGGTYTGLLGPELGSIIDLLQAALPNTQLFCTSPLMVAGVRTNDTTIVNEIMPIAVGRGVPFINMSDTTINYFTGTGNVSSPTGDGNADYYRASDGTHPSDAGHFALARMMAGKIATQLGLNIGETSQSDQVQTIRETPSWRPTGAITETCPRNQRLAAIPLTSGRLSLAGGAVIPAGKTVSNITFVTSTTAAGTPTNQWFCLVDQNLNVLAKTADDTTTAWAASTPKTLALSSPYTPSVNTPVYAGIVVVATTTPTIEGPESAAAGAGAASVTPMIAAKSTSGLTNPASLGATAGALTGDNLMYAYLT